MASKLTLMFWVLLVLSFLSMMSTLDAWNLWRSLGPDSMVSPLPQIGGLQANVASYFFVALAVTVCFMGAITFVAFRRQLSETAILELTKDLEEKLDEKSQEIRDSTEKALTKLGLREFQLKESMKTLQKRVEETNERIQKNLEDCRENLETARGKLTEINRIVGKIHTGQKSLSELKKLRTIENVEKDLKSIQGIMQKIDYASEPCLSSTDKVETLEGNLLKRGTVQKLKLNGLERIDDILLRSAVEIAITEAMSEDEAKSLQSIIQLLMVPGVQRSDAMLLLRSGIDSKQELSRQDPFNLGARMSKTAELYIKEGKLKEEERPTLEEISAWIKWAKP